MKLRDDLVLRHVGEDHIIVDPNQGVVDMSKVFTLNDSAAWLWESLIGKEFEINVIIELLVAQYGITVAQAAHDAKKLIELFEQNDLLAP